MVRALVYLGDYFIVPGVSMLPFLFGITIFKRFYCAEVIMPQEKYDKDCDMGFVSISA